MQRTADQFCCDIATPVRVVRRMVEELMNKSEERLCEANELWNKRQLQKG